MGKITTKKCLCVTFIILEQCLTKEGDQCIFPFKYEGKLYSHCIDQEPFGSVCATKVDQNKNPVKDHIGICRDSCPTNADIVGADTNEKELEGKHNITI